MTACVNRKHTKKVAAVVTASLVGALSLGAAPVAAMADTGIDLQFATPEGAFSNAEVIEAQFDHIGHYGNWVTPDANGVYNTTYEENKPVVLTAFRAHFFGTTEQDTFLIDLASGDYEVAYFNRDSKGMPTGDEITSDIYKVGQYVAKVTAVDGDYKGGVIYIPFDIDPIQISNITVDGSDTVTYDGKAHEFSFLFNGLKVYEGTDYTVEYIKTGHDGTNVQEVKDEGTYVAKITGIGNYAGSVELSQLITVKPLNLNKAYIVGLTSSASQIEPKNLYAIYINGEWNTGDDPIMGELKAELSNPKDVWFENKAYQYTVTEAKATDNITGWTNFVATKVAYDLSFSYDGTALADSYEVIKSDASSHWNPAKLSAHADDTTIDGIDIDASKITCSYLDSNGNPVDVDVVNSVAGTYTAIIQYNDSKVGGVKMVTITTYQEAVNTDAKAAVIYDADGDGLGGVVVSSIQKGYDGNDLLDGPFIRVAVEDAAGNNVADKCSVKYYNSDGMEVGKIVDAGTYTLKVTSNIYKLSGTTELTITVGKLDLSDVRVSALENAKFDDVHDGVWYLPWEKDGVTLDELGLEYKSGDSWIPFPMNMVKATVLDSEGNEVKKIEDEGVYTIHFEARNDDAANNYVVPADITVTCIKDGSAGTVDHLVFTDVSYTDYFADPVYYVNQKKFMNGYANTNIFGSYDAITRGQVACVLYNMAMDNRKVDEDSLHYVEGEGYVTGFTDVDGEMYYAKAIAWAKQAGVINGYGDGTFAPDAPVTREEFCAMLANYASKYDESYAEGDVDSLAKFDDAEGVSEWAEKVVAWGVENGIIGNGGFLNAQGAIIRADAACMVYNYAIAE